MSKSSFTTVDLEQGKTIQGGPFVTAKKKNETEHTSQCCHRTGAWIWRNWIHASLLALAVIAILGSVLGSLDSCDSKIQNITVSTTRTVNSTINVTFTTPLASVVAIDGSGSMSGTKWTDAKRAIEVLNNELDEALNVNDTDKLRTGLIQWSDLDDARVEANLALGVSGANAAARSMSLINSLTYWGPGLCECYKMIANGGDLTAGANKLCTLVADGDMTGSAVGEGVCANDGSRGANGACACDYLWNDAAAENYVSTGGFSSSSVEYVEEYMKSKDIKILSILVGSSSKTNIYRASSCDNIPEANSEDCDYFFQLTDFSALEVKARDIAAQQQAVATSTESSTVTDSETISTSTAESVSICSLDFLWSLLALGPLLAFIVYRACVIKMKSKSIRRLLTSMIKTKEIDRSDVSNLAHVATRLLLPNNHRSDIDYWISWLLHQCPCMLPVSRSEFDALTAATTIAL